MRPPRWLDVVYACALSLLAVSVAALTVYIIVEDKLVYP